MVVVVSDPPLRGRSNEYPGVVPRVQSMSVHSVLARLSVGVVRCSLVARWCSLAYRKFMSVLSRD